MEKKYLKYKNKYIKLKEQIAGSTFSDFFETNFIDIIDCIKEYNIDELRLDDMGIGTNSFIHVKGGASIKYHMIQLEKREHINITSDIDIFLVNLDEDDENNEEKKQKIDKNISKLLDKIRNKLPGSTWEVVNSNGLYIITVNGHNIIDITIYDDTYIDDDPDTSMFYYTLRQIPELSGINDISELYHTYFTILLKKDDIYHKTFTTNIFELHSTIRGIQIQNSYLELVDSWKQSLVEHQKYLETIQPEYQDKIASIQRKIRRYEKQTSQKYIDKLVNKKDRYEKKLQILKKILGIE